MFYVRLNKLRILKNRELLGKGEVQFMSFVNHSQEDFPNLDAFFETNDDAIKKQIIKEAIANVVQSRILMPIYKVKDGSIITFGDTGYIVYENETIPKDFSWQLIGIELDKRMRDKAVLLQQLLIDANVQPIIKEIEALSLKSSSIKGAVVLLSKLVVNTILTLAKNDKDDQIGYFLSSFIEPLDYPHGIRNKQDVPDLTGNMFVDYSIFGYKEYAIEGIKSLDNEA